MTHPNQEGAVLEVYTTREHSKECRADSAVRSGTIADYVSPWATLPVNHGLRKINGKDEWCYIFVCGDNRRCSAEMYVGANQLVNYLHGLHEEQSK